MEATPLSCLDEAESGRDPWFLLRESAVEYLAADNGDRRYAHAGAALSLLGDRRIAQVALDERNALLSSHAFSARQSGQVGVEKISIQG